MVGPAIMSLGAVLSHSSTNKSLFMLKKKKVAAEARLSASEFWALYLQTE